MMLELLGSIIISQIQPPSGPPYYPRPDKPAGHQGYSNCKCKPHPNEGETESRIFSYLGNHRSWPVQIQEYRYNGALDPTQTVYMYYQNSTRPPFGCYEIVQKWDIFWAGPQLGAEAQGPTVDHQPECSTYSPPCPAVRIQGMPGQTIRVRCKSGEDDCTTDGPIPKGQ